MSDTKTKTVAEQINEQEFEISRSKRYHGHRMAWHQSMALFLQFVELCATSSVLLVPMSKILQQIILCVGFIVAGMSLVQLAGKRLQWHAAKKAAFGELMKRILTTEEEWTEKDVRDILVRREEIEKDDDAGFRCLDALCYNEECLARGRYNEKLPLSWWQRNVGTILPIDYIPLDRSKHQSQPQRQQAQ